jgi:hypothetical protein
MHHLSYPALSSVNEFIDESSTSVKYSSIDDAVEMIQSLGKGAKLVISDIKKAFRMLPVWPGDFDLFGFRIKDKFYFDQCLPMRASISGALFEKFLHSCSGKSSMKVKTNLQFFIIWTTFYLGVNLKLLSVRRQCIHLSRFVPL